MIVLLGGGAACAAPVQHSARSDEWSFIRPSAKEIFLISSSEKIQFCCDHD
ncbi:hypothetical protein [Cupriavidus oxalaticus]|uniref:hypothetical protein n=1 Tax=Cupriavidus oxalaticus TaxID=96344 RepID=UPI00316FF9AB